MKKSLEFKSSANNTRFVTCCLFIKSEYSVVSWCFKESFGDTSSSFYECLQSSEMYDCLLLNVFGWVFFFVKLSKQLRHWQPCLGIETVEWRVILLCGQPSEPFKLESSLLQDNVGDKWLHWLFFVLQNSSMLVKGSTCFSELDTTEGRR